MEQILNILNQFDGYGLVITDYDLIKERFKNMQELKQLESMIDVYIQNKGVNNVNGK
tara:strand:+ start:469 stop:639 length:171 start_codon:yes stop_codon:yes gene_type:complete